MTEVNLTVRDELGQVREVLVQSKRFTIGRTPENDLAINNSNLSRRHAVIENFDDQVQITDCGSQNGTEVNGVPITPTAILQDGDLVTLAGVCDIEVAIKSEVSVSPKPVSNRQDKGGRNIASPQARSPAAARVAQQRVRPQQSASLLASPIFQGVAVAAGLLVILGSIVALLLIINQTSDNRNSSNRQADLRNENTGNNNTGDVEATPEATVTTGNSNTNNNGSTLTKERIEAGAVGVMRRLSSDDKTYGFSDKALQDIERKVDQYRSSSTLTGNLVALQRSSSSLVAMAREQGMEPGLLIFVVLTLAENRGGGDPRSIAQGTIADLLALRATFGTNDADSSLLILAAYKMGRGEKRSHPLLGTIRHLVKNPLTQRNVWFLNDRGGLDSSAYDFVLSVIALGVIAQSPSEFGINAPPLVF